MTAPIFAEKQHDLQVDVAPGLVVDGDRIRIAQVLSNLLFERGEGSAFVIRLPSAMPVASTSSVDDRGAVVTSHAPVGCVMVVDDNRDALDLALQIHPDIAVLDIGLPDMNGFELARAAGFDAFFAKPADIPALLGALHRLSAAGQT